MRRLRAFLLAGALLTFTVGSAPAQQTNSELWPELNVFVRLSRDVRTFTLVTPTREVDQGRFGDVTDMQVGQFIEVGLRPLIPARAAQSRRDSSRIKYLRLRSGIEYQGLPGASNEWRIVEELTPRLFLPGEVVLLWRNRGEARWIDGVPSWRYRSRLWFEREFRTGRSATLVPYVSAEPFFDSRYDRFIRLRCQFGATVPLSARFTPEVNYTYQTDESGGEVLTTHALNIVVAVFF